MDAVESFLRRAVVRRLERHLDFAQSEKRRTKFLSTFSHELESDLNVDATVDSIPDSVLDQPAYLYSPPDTFGADLPRLRDLLDGSETSCLGISVDGSAAIFRHEDWIDDQMFFYWS